MRIIAGRLRSRRLAAPPGLKTRPSSDRLRETLFNVLAPRIEGAAFLDLYAGSGAVGMEALSRGAARAEFVERAAGALKALRGNLAGLGLREGVEVRAESVGSFLRSLSAAHLSGKDKYAAKVGHAGFDIVFLDPPYDAGDEYEATLGLLGDASLDPGSPSARDLHPSDEDLSLGTPDRGHPILRDDAVVIAEHRRKDVLKDEYGWLKRTRLLKQGDAALSFYVLASERASEPASQRG